MLAANIFNNAENSLNFTRKKIVIMSFYNLINHIYAGTEENSISSANDCGVFAQNNLNSCLLQKQDIVLIDSYIFICNIN